MKCVIFTGTHRRHLSMFSEVAESFSEIMLVVMEREEMIPQPDEGLNHHDRANFIRHFENREMAEQEFFGSAGLHAFSKAHIVKVTREGLLSDLVLQKVKEFDANIAFVFGTGLILGDLLEALPENKINIHLGLSPWYRGAATLFWPFFMLQPQYAGVTFHQIIPSPDAGEIIHQCVPCLETGDTIHRVAAKAVVQANTDLKRIIAHFHKHKKFDAFLQNTTGRLWLNRDFKPHHLRVNYDLFEDRMVDAYLSGQLGSDKPKLLTCLQD